MTTTCFGDGPGYLIGNTVRFRIAVDDPVRCTPVDPDTITLKLIPPGETVPTSYVFGTDPEIKRLSRGVYVGDVTLNVIGSWRWRWEVTGELDGATEGRVLVKRSIM